MQTHYVFVDYDNTHMGNVGLISKSSQKLKVKVFLGAHHNVIPLSLARALQPLGTDAEYVQFDHGRRNTIDFTIAFQLGELAIQHPDEQFSILTNDPGFNEIVSGLKEKGINCARYSDMESFIKSLSEPVAAANEKSHADKIIDIMDPRKR
jgi:hypothetical protein